VDVVLDDRLLIEELLVGLGRSDINFHTTSYWYFRALRAAVFGAGGHLSGPFRELPSLEQQRAIASMLQLPENVGLPVSRDIVPVMIDVAGRNPKLNLLSLEAVATARVLNATIWLSPESANGILPTVLDAETLTWATISLS
jgi:hypothetical protein